MDFDLTPLFYAVLPVTGLILAYRRDWLLPWAILLSVFQAASIVNVSSGTFVFGLQPGLFVAIVYVVAVAPAMLRRSGAGMALLRRTYFPLTALTATAVVSAIALPHLWRGLSVYPPRAGVNIESAAPLQPSTTNVSQVLYLIFFLVFAFVVSKAVSRSGVPPLALRAFAAAGIIMSVVGFYQVLALSQDLPYPLNIIYSNPGYTQLFNQSIAGGIPRLSTTFTEPSVAGYHLVGVFALTSWVVLSGNAARLFVASAILSGLALIMTTSTSGLLGFLFVLGLLLLRVFRTRPEIRRRFGLVIGGIVASSLTLLLVWGVIAEGSVSSNVSRLFREILFEKALSESFANRFVVDGHSLALLPETFGTGVGWGSNRAASLVPHIASNGGLWGLVLMAVFGWRVRDLYRKAIRRADAPDRSRSIQMGLSGAIVSMLLVGVIGVPDPTYLLFWLLLALLIGHGTWAMRTGSPEPHARRERYSASA